MTNPPNPRFARAGDPWQELIASARQEVTPRASDDLAAAEDFSRRVVSRWLSENRLRGDRWIRAPRFTAGGASMWETLGLRGLAVAAALAVAALLWGFAPDATAGASGSEFFILDPLSGLLSDR